MHLHQASDRVVVSGAGLWTPEPVITNEELVAALNAYADRFNEEHQGATAAGSSKPVAKSGADCIVQASGIKQRHVYIKDGILDTNRMRPLIPARSDDDLSHQAEIALHAA